MNTLIRKIKQDDGSVTFCLSEDEVWRPGAFRTIEDARHGAGLSDEQILAAPKDAEGFVCFTS